MNKTWITNSLLTVTVNGTAIQKNKSNTGFAYRSLPVNRCTCIATSFVGRSDIQNSVYWYINEAANIVTCHLYNSLAGHADKI